MSRFFRLVATFLVVAATLSYFGKPSETLQAQPKPAPIAVPPTFPTLTTPATFGAKKGETATLTLTGTNLLDATGVWTSFGGKVTIPPDQKDATKLNISVEVPANTAIGMHSMRVATKAGVSNLRPFIVDELTTVPKKDATNNKKDTPQVVATPCVVTGGLVAENSDFYKFSVKAGETLTVEALARRLGSQLDPVVILYDGSGREMPGLYADDTPGLQTDARVTHTFPTAGEVIVEIRDTTYRGGPDFTYRLRIGNFPGATTAYPLFVERGKKADIAFSGPNMEGVKPVSVTAPTTGEALYVAPKREGGLSGWPVEVRLSDIPEGVEQEPNNEIAKANKLSVPGGVTARFLEKNDVDYFSFTGKKGAKYAIQALTFEVNTSTEVYFRILDAKGAELAKSNPQQPNTRLEFSPTADGDFYIACEHTNFVSGPNEVYHLSIRPVVPDFNVTVGTDRIDVPAGGVGLLPITGLGKLNGFTGPVELKFNGGDGVTGTLTLPATANPQPGAPIFMPIAAKAGTKLGPVIGTLTATTKVDNATITRTGTIFEIAKAALGNIPNPPSEMTTQIAVAVTAEPPFTLTLTFEKNEVVKGTALKGKIVAKRNGMFAEDIVIAAASLPAGAAPTFKPIPKGMTEAEVSINFPAAVPAGPGTIVLRGTAKVGGKDVSAVALPVSITVAEPPKK